MPKPSRFPAQHEPEVIFARAKANSYQYGTIPLYPKEIIVEGTRIMSRQADASVTEKTAVSFRRLPVRLRRAVHAICCDPETSTCLISLNNGGRSKAESLANHFIKLIQDEFRRNHVIYIADIHGLVGIMHQNQAK